MTARCLLHSHDHQLHSYLLLQLFVHLGGVRDDGEVPPVSATNDIDLVTLYRSLRAPPEEPF